MNTIAFKLPYGIRIRHVLLKVPEVKNLVERLLSKPIMLSYDSHNIVMF